MKSFMPWFCLAFAATNVAYSEDGLDAYRQGNYLMAAQQLNPAPNNDPVVDYYLGEMRLYGYGQLKNNALALRQFTQAAERGFLPAVNMMARYALIEQRDPVEALRWFKQAADKNDTPALMYCASAYLFGLGVKKNIEYAKRYYIPAAKNGDSIAQYTLADDFINSRSAQNKKLGLLWLNKSVAQGNPKAQLKLSELFAKGGLVEQDMKRAEQLAQLAAQQGYMPAFSRLGDMALQQNDFLKAKDWYVQAANKKYPPAEMALANLYLNNKSPFYDPKTGFLWMLKAAQNDVIPAQTSLALLYKQGIGVPADANIALEWQQKANAKTKVAEDPATSAVQWLSNDKFDQFISSNYQLTGIFSDWRNPLALQQNNYNASPQMEVITRETLYQPAFVMANPNTVPIAEYFDALASSLGSQQPEWSFPRYPIDKHIAALERNDSYVVRHEPRTSIIDEGVLYATDDNAQPYSYVRDLTEGWEKQANYQAVFNQLHEEAVLGNPDAQFQLAQLYQFGYGVEKNAQQASYYYQLAAVQQDTRAEYNLGLLYLQGLMNQVDYDQGIAWLTDAAFKGNPYAQYALSRIYEHGYGGTADTPAIQSNGHLAMSMDYLAAANNFPLSLYSLADHMVKKNKGQMTLAEKQKRVQLITRLYREAATQGVAEAVLPLAFFDAMNGGDKAKQAKAFEVAQKEARTGNPQAALLLGMMYDRGLSVPANPEQAVSWYQQASDNPVKSFILGTYYSNGLGVNADKEKGKRLLQAAADAGFAYANLNLAIMQQQQGDAFLPELEKAVALGNSTAGLLLADYYLSQANNPQNMEQARAIYQNFADKGDKKAQLKLAYMFDKGFGGPMNAEQALHWYTAAAEQNDSKAQYLLGQLYQVGSTQVLPDYEAAKKWYAAAEKRYSPAAVALGFIYDTIEANYAKAMGSYQQAADRHDPTAQYNLGLIYENGKGFAVDYAKAKDFYSQAAAQGHRGAMVQLAGILFNGYAGERNALQAFDWYKKSAALGDPTALYYLGLLSETGVATSVNYPDAVNYYQQSAAKGNAKAMLALARMYQFGLGVARDNEKMLKFYKQLADQQNAFAQYQLGRYYLEMAQADHSIPEGKRWLEQAQNNGNGQAKSLLQWLMAQEQERLSFIQPLSMPKKLVVGMQQPLDLLYLEALSEWNRGNDTDSRSILDNILVKFPNYEPARKAYEQLNQHMNLSEISYNK